MEVRILNQYFSTK